MNKNNPIGFCLCPSSQMIMMFMILLSIVFLPMNSIFEVNAWIIIHPTSIPVQVQVHTSYFPIDKGDVVRSSLLSSSSSSSPFYMNGFQLSTTTATKTTLSDHVFNWAVVVRSSKIGETVIGKLGEVLVPSAYAADTTATGPPTKEEITTLQKAFSIFYSPPAGQERAQKALPLLNESIVSFQRQPSDERAGLYRVRGDCYMALQKPRLAIEDYTTAIELLQLPEAKEKADPVELPASFLGRARAIRSLGPTYISKSQASTSVNDYQQALALNSESSDNTMMKQKIVDGCKTNPYAAWEYGMALRQNEQYEEAKSIHVLTSTLFDGISDRSRAVISLLDAGIDAACQEASLISSSSSTTTTTTVQSSGSNVIPLGSKSSSSNNNDISNEDDAKSILMKGIQYTTTSESRDVALLQRVVAKEGEGRIVLAALEWTDPNDTNKLLRNNAEQNLSLACERLGQLEQDGLQRLDNDNKSSLMSSPIGSTTYMTPTPTSTSGSNDPLRFNIDDYPGALDTNCIKIQKNIDFQTSRLEWPIVLQEKVQKLFTLK